MHLSRSASAGFVFVLIGASAARAQETTLSTADLATGELVPGISASDLRWSELAPAPWAARQEQEATPPQQKERWSSFLPLMKEEALSRGYQLPLPFGTGVTLSLLTGRDIEVDDLRIGVNGAPPSSVSDFVDLGSESDVFNANLKLDAWILPFLNVYVLLGYVYNESDTKVHVTLPNPPGTQFDLDVDTTLDGFVGGGGLTLAAGYDDFFMVIDSNYSKTDIGFDDKFSALTASMRAGYQSTLDGKQLQLWTGAAYWDTANTATSTTDVPGVGRVHFEADQGPVYPWLVDFGGNLRVAQCLEFFVDMAFDMHGGAIFTIGPVFRF